MLLLCRSEMIYAFLKNCQFDVRVSTNFKFMLADICVKFSTSYRMLQKIIVVLKVSYTQASFN